MKKNIISLFILVVMVITIVTPVSAASGTPPQGSCPPGFDLHQFDMQMDHQYHIGLKVDLNGDGLICMKMLDNGLHVHMDNVLH